MQHPSSRYSFQLIQLPSSAPQGLQAPAPDVPQQYLDGQSQPATPKSSRAEPVMMGAHARPHLGVAQEQRPDHGCLYSAQPAAQMHFNQASGALSSATSSPGTAAWAQMQSLQPPQSQQATQPPQQKQHRDHPQQHATPPANRLVQLPSGVPNETIYTQKWIYVPHEDAWVLGAAIANNGHRHAGQQQQQAPPLQYSMPGAFPTEPRHEQQQHVQNAFRHAAPQNESEHATAPSQAAAPEQPMAFLGEAQTSNKVFSSAPALIEWIVEAREEGKTDAQILQNLMAMLVEEL